MVEEQASEGRGREEEGRGRECRGGRGRRRRGRKARPRRTGRGVSRESESGSGMKFGRDVAAAAAVTEERQ